MNEESLSQLYLKDTAFGELMQRRIFNVLLVASPYDAFMMEEDGRVEEQLYNEYVALNLSSPPRITRVANINGALEMMNAKHFDLVIAMPGMDISDTFTTAKTIKAEEAKAMGLVSEVYPADELMDKALELAETIASKAQVAIRQSKRCIRRGMQTDMYTGTAYEAEAFGVCCATEDQKGAMKAFTEKTLDSYTYLNK